MIFTHTNAKSAAYTKLAQWYNKVEELGFNSFRSIINTIYDHYKDILNYFDNRSTTMPLLNLSMQNLKPFGQL
jgi:transposase